MVQERDVDAANSALLIYLACVRKLLRRFNGYECQEADGSFMLAFKHPVDSVLFCLAVRFNQDTGLDCLVPQALPQTQPPAC